MNYLNYPQALIAHERSQRPFRNGTLPDAPEGGGASETRFVHRQSYALPLFALLILLSGCVNVMRPGSPPSQEKLRIETDHPEQFQAIIQKGGTYSVPADGRIVIDVPALAHGCTTYLFGVVKVADASSRNVPILRIMKNGKAKKTLSLSQLTSLPIDSDGYYVVRQP
ncbi:MAG: hypothetical protein IPM17_17745 [Verrucomicrobia bacterium]|nr:hypothetical protein [Verrucomicrobiota bacterium]